MIKFNELLYGFKGKLLNPLSVRIRILPIVIICATMMLAFRIYNIKLLLEGGEELFGITLSHAEPAAAGTQAATPVKEETKSLAEGGKKFDPLNLSADEVRILEGLSNKKAELEKREASVDEKSKVVEATEKRINEKVEELKSLKTSIEAMVKQHDESQDQKLKGLIKTYETMKPADAARLFSNMSLDVLIKVLGGMKDSKKAAVLAKMDANIAAAITVELAKRQELSDAAKVATQ